MSKNYTIISTLTGAEQFNASNLDAGTRSFGFDSVTIRGGANLVNVHQATNSGIGTEVTADQLEFLKAHHAFRHHVEAGFMLVYDSFSQLNKEKIEGISKDLQERDGNAPIVEGDLPSLLTEVQEQTGLTVEPMGSESPEYKNPKKPTKN